MAKKQAVSNVTDVQNAVIPLALDKILVDEAKNLRRFHPDTKAVQELAEDIKVNKLINPVLVRELAEPVGDMTHELVAGFQRMKAIRYLNDNGNAISDVNASVVEVNGAEPLQNKLLNLSENIKRNELSFIDTAFAIGDLLDSGMTGVQIAAQFKKSNAWVTYVAKLRNLRPEVQKKIHDGKIPFRLARTLSDMTEEEQDQAIAAMEAGEGGSSIADKHKKKKGRKDKRGRKAQGDQATGSNISSKQAILLIDEQIKALTEGEGTMTKNEEWAADLYKGFSKFLSGGLGIKALHNRIMKAV